MGCRSGMDVFLRSLERAYEVDELSPTATYRMTQSRENIHNIICGLAFAYPDARTTGRAYVPII